MSIKSRSIGPKKHPMQSKQNSTRSQNQSNGKESFGKQSECNYCGASAILPKEKFRAVLLKCKCRKCAKEGHVARKSLSKHQNVNALDDSVSDDGQETYHLITLYTHSVRSLSVQKGKSFSPRSNYQQQKLFLLGKRSN